MNNRNSINLDSKALEGVSSNLNSLKQKINGVWTGDVANILDSEYSNVIASIEQLNQQINIFSNALTKLDIYSK